MLCPCLKYESGPKKTDMHMVSRQHSIAARAKIMRRLMQAKAFDRESKTNNEDTVAVLCQRHDFILLYHFFHFLIFLIKNFISFCSSFYYCNRPENSHHHAYFRHHAN